MSCNGDDEKGDLPFVRGFRRRPQGDREALDDAAEPLLDGTLTGDDAPPQLAAAAHVLAAARHPPRPDELAGESEARRAFTNSLPATGAPGRRRRGRPMAVAIAAAVALGATGAAAATGNLPRPAQNAASDMLGRVGVSVPDGDDDGLSVDTTSAVTTGTDANSSADVLVCEAYAQGVHEESIGFRAVLAVIGEGEVVEFCESVAAANPSPPGGANEPGGADPPGLDGGTPPGLDEGTPPGQGGVPPGQGGTPPGQDGTPRRQGGTPPGQGGTPPGQDGTPPGQDGTPPGQDGTPPGQGGPPPGQGGTPPGRSGDNPGQGSSPSPPGLQR